MCVLFVCMYCVPDPFMIYFMMWETYAGGGGVVGVLSEWGAHTYPIN